MRILRGIWNFQDNVGWKKMWFIVKEKVWNSHPQQKDEELFPQYWHNKQINQEVTWFSFYFIPIEPWGIDGLKELLYKKL